MIAIPCAIGLLRNLFAAPLAAEMLLVIRFRHMQIPWLMPLDRTLYIPFFSVVSTIHDKQS
jgi:hypothetical protein